MLRKIAPPEIQAETTKLSLIKRQNSIGCNTKKEHKLKKINREKAQQQTDKKKKLVIYLLAT